MITHHIKMLKHPPIIKTIAISAFAISISSTGCFAQSKGELYGFEPGQMVSAKVVRARGEESFFTCTQVPDSVFSIMKGKTYKASCTISLQQLRYLRCLHKDKQGNSIVGEMVVNAKIATKVLAILHKLYVSGYPIQRMRLMDYWNADDERAMRDNNSSCFNFRFISHTHKVSKHGMGMAIDINTLYNPYHKKLRNGKEITEPETGKAYLDRTKKFDYKIEKGDLCYRLFTEAGFKWGGDWVHSKDYQHFEY